MRQNLKEYGLGSDWKSSIGVTVILASAVINTAACEVPEKYRRQGQGQVAKSTSNWTYENVVNVRNKFKLADANDENVPLEVKTDSPRQFLATSFDSEVRITNNIKSALFYQDLVRDYKTLVNENFLDDAVLLLLERIQSELSNENFTLVEDLLLKFPNENLGIESLIATLSVTHNAKEYLPTRKIFYDSVKDYLGTVRTKSEVVGLLHGLD